MKKVLRMAALAVALISGLSFSTVAYAASVTTTTEIVGVGRNEQEAQTQQVLGARRSTPNGLGLKSGEIKDETVLNELSDLEFIAKVISDYLNVDVKASDLLILDSMEISHDANTEVSESKPLYITFSFPAITDDSEVYVLHKSNGVWHVVPTTVSEGLVIGEFKSLSPVAIVAKTGSLRGAVLGSNRTKSPRTGDYSYMLLICAAVLGAGSVFVIKK